MTSELHKYNEGLITLGELAEKEPVTAIQVMHEEFLSIFARFDKQLQAMQLQLDAVTDMLYDLEK